MPLFFMVGVNFAFGLASFIVGFATGVYLLTKFFNRDIFPAESILDEIKSIKYEFSDDNS